MDYKQLWNGVLVEMELSVSKANFNNNKHRLKK